MTPKKTVTIRDIARKAKVSPSTVSRILNDSTPVAEEKREAVMDAIGALNYRPNAMAQGLARGRSMTIGVITPDIASPFFGSLLRGVEDGLAGSGYHPIFASGNWQKQAEEETLQILLGRRVDGLIMVGGEIPDERLRQLSQQIPLVLIGRSVNGLEDRCLRVDDFQGAYTAVRYLLDLGHRRIAHVTGVLTHQDAVSRRAGYCQALVDAGIELKSELLVEGDFTEQSGVMAVEMLLAQATTFTAVFTANDQIAIGVCLALYRRGLRIPEDVSLVGFDDQPGSAYTTPPLTTIRQPTTLMGQTAAEAILNLLENDVYTIPTFPVELVVRESTMRCR